MGTIVLIITPTTDHGVQPTTRVANPRRGPEMCRWNRYKRIERSRKDIAGLAERLETNSGDEMNAPISAYFFITAYFFFEEVGGSNQFKTKSGVFSFKKSGSF